MTQSVVAYDPAPSPRPVSRPALPLPPGAWDTHAHVFGPFAQFPILEPRRYNPPLATAHDHLAMLDAAGFARGVLVHSSASGYDNSVTVDAVSGSNGRVLGVAVVQPSTSDRQLEQMHAAGFRSVRFTINGPRSQQFTGSLDFDDLRRFAPRLRALGWHAQIWAKCEYLVEQAAVLRGYDIPLVIDHMGYFEPARGVQDPLFQAFLRQLRDADYWVKMTPIRLDKSDPTYANVRPFHDALVQAIPERIMFASDWPYISLDANPPDPGRLVDLFDQWTPDVQIRHQLFVDNPRALYLR
jgi:2-pyrone-4,6-dicarboxylate lactonase